MNESPDGPEYADPEVYRALAGFDTEWRDTWWNDDFLAFILARWGLGDSRRVLDVGCGAGHWGRSLLRALPEEARLDGVDIEPSFPELASKQAAERGLASRCTYQSAPAEELPFDDDSFDLVTCQTVLIHVADAATAVREMIRVLRPGGWLLAAEPDNLTSASSLLNLHPRPSAERVLAILELQMTCERGKAALGEGDSSIGGRLPGLLAQSGLTEIAVALNENCPMLVPPYDRGHQPLQLATELEFAEAGITMFTGTRNDTQRAFAAGDGDPERFDALWAHIEGYIEDFRGGVASKQLHGARGQTFYLVAGRKP